MHCCIPTSTTDNNSSTGMILVTLKMYRSAGGAVNHQGNVMELSANFTSSGEWSPCFIEVTFCNLSCGVCVLQLKRVVSCTLSVSDQQSTF